MEKALILLKIECTGDNCIEETLNKVKQKNGVKESGLTFGEYDSYLIVEVGNSSDMQKFVMGLREHPSIVSTMTLLIID
jgi:uncharacterized protein with GYD domain